MQVSTREAGGTRTQADEGPPQPRRAPAPRVGLRGAWGSGSAAPAATQPSERTTAAHTSGPHGQGFQRGGPGHPHTVIRICVCVCVGGTCQPAALHLVMCHSPAASLSPAPTPVSALPARPPPTSPCSHPVTSPEPPQVGLGSPRPGGGQRSDTCELTCRAAGLCLRICNSPGAESVPGHGARAGGPRKAATCHVCSVIVCSAGDGAARSSPPGGTCLGVDRATERFCLTATPPSSWGTGNGCGSFPRVENDDSLFRREKPPDETARRAPMESNVETGRGPACTRAWTFLLSVPSPPGHHGRGH